MVDLGLLPKLAPQDSDNSTARLTRISEIVRTSKFGIHDLSRCRATASGEYSRHNMPFELGLDFGAKIFGDTALKGKSILVLEECQYDYQKCLSDISGWDIRHHQFDYVRLTRIVRDWLVRQAAVEPQGAASIRKNYTDFQEWYWQRETRRGASQEDILEYPTVDVVDAMLEWVGLNRPLA